MKLEFLDDITGGGMYPDADPDKLIRLYSFDQEEAEKLKNIIQYWIINKGETVELSALPFVQPINCSLLLEITVEDQGIDLSSENKFVCRLSIESYKQMVDYISVFTDREYHMGGYNWLYDPKADKIDLLFSPGGTW